METELKYAFITDCVETHGLTNDEAGLKWIEVGMDFVDSMIDDMWDNWSENFPNVGVRNGN